MNIRLCCLVALLSIFTALKLPAAELDLTPLKVPGLIQTPIGVTRKGTPIPAVITADDLDYNVKKVRLLLIGGLDGSARTTAATISVVKRFYTEPQFAGHRQVIALSAIICGNPDGHAAGTINDNGSGGKPASGYPPQGPSYESPTDPERHYIWRWIGMHAPDDVIELVEGPKSDLVDSKDLPPDSLTAQLSSKAACNVGSIEAERWSVAPGDDHPFRQYSIDVLKAFSETGFNLNEVMSPARKEMISRVKRTPLEVSEQLAKVYGHDLPSAAYIPAVACLGRVRLSRLTGDASHLADIERIVAPYRNGEKPSLTDKSSGSDVAGHILWGVLYDATKNKEYISLVLQGANRGFDKNGEPLAAMPSHSEMSDAVFMGCPILAQAGRLTGEKKYFDMCVRHMRFMTKLNVRKDGIHRHSPLDETAWGRGNGFPALGLSLSLGDLPADHPDRGEMLATFQAHMKAMLPHQDPTGPWHQVVDHPESYRELTVTCMTTFAMIRGVRQGWLPRETYEPAIRKAWYAINSRVGADGGLVDVCTGTGKMKSLREYYDRTALLGRDGRGGAMALLVATEMADWEREQGTK
jgi:rhamnogalacturonyl hydrolase YesR